MSTHSLALSKEPVSHYYSGSGTFRIYGINPKAAVYRRRTGHAVRPRDTADQRLTAVISYWELDCKGPGSNGLPKSNLSNSGANYTTGASASPLNRCFVPTILLHMFPSHSGMLFREAGKLSKLVLGFPAFNIHSPWKCPEKCLSATCDQVGHFL